MRSASCRWERNEISSCHSRRASLTDGRVRFRPRMLDVLQHRKGDLSARSARDQPGRADTVIPPSGIHDPRRVGGISLRKEARSRASQIVCTRRFNVGIGDFRAFRFSGQTQQGHLPPDAAILAREKSPQAPVGKSQKSQELRPTERDLEQPQMEIELFEIRRSYLCDPGVVVGSVASLLLQGMNLALHRRHLVV